MSKALSFSGIAVIQSYRLTLGPILGGACRFEPSCSEYGLQAFKSHNPAKATHLTLTRLCKCHPFGPSGYDPVPPSPYPLEKETQNGFTK